MVPGGKSELIHLFVGTIGGGPTRAKPRSRFRICFAVEENAPSGLGLLAVGKEFARSESQAGLDLFIERSAMPPRTSTAAMIASQSRAGWRSDQGRSSGRPE